MELNLAVGDYLWKSSNLIRQLQIQWYFIIHCDPWTAKFNFTKVIHYSFRQIFFRPHFLLIRYVCILYIHSYILPIELGQRATAPSLICQGSDVTLSCLILRNGRPVDIQWKKNEMIIDIDSANYDIVINATLNAITGLVIIDIPLDDNNAEYSCNVAGGNINSAVTLNVTGTVILYACHYICISGYCNLISCKFLLIPWVGDTRTHTHTHTHSHTQHTLTRTHTHTHTNTCRHQHTPTSTNTHTHAHNTHTHTTHTHTHAHTHTYTHTHTHTQTHAHKHTHTHTL